MLTLAVIETIAPFLLVFAAIGLAAALYGRQRLGAEAFRAELRLNGAALVSAAAWLGLSVAVTYSVSSTGGTFGPGYGGAWSILGAPSILSVYPKALLSPGSAVAALAHDGGLKALYVVAIYGGLAFLPFFGKVRYQLPALGWIGLAVLSNHVGYYVVNDQYFAYMLPFLFPAAITGVGWLRRADVRPLERGLRSPTIGGLLVASVVVTSLVISPFLVYPVDSFNAVPHGLPGPLHR